MKNVKDGLIRDIGIVYKEEIVYCVIDISCYMSNMGCFFSNILKLCIIYLVDRENGQFSVTGDGCC